MVLQVSSHDGAVEQHSILILAIGSCISFHALKKANVLQNVFGALAILSYHLGRGNIPRSTLPPCLLTHSNN